MTVTTNQVTLIVVKGIHDGGRVSKLCDTGGTLQDKEVPAPVMDRACAAAVMLI